MNALSPGRALALVLSRLSGQASLGVLDALPHSRREEVVSALDDVDRLAQSQMSIVEQTLTQELDRLFGDSDSPREAFLESYPIRVADILTLILIKIPAGQAASILSHLPYSVQAECVQATAAQDWAALEHHLGAEERALLGDLDAWLGAPARSPRPDQATDMLRHVGSPRQLRTLLTVIHHRDSEVAKAIQAELFSIEDLRRLTDRELQAVTTGLDDWDLAVAMLGFSDGLQRRVLSNVSQRRAVFLQEDVDYLRDSDEEDIEATCGRVLMRARLLYETGHVQTYLGSVSSEPLDPDEDKEEEEVRRAPRKAQGEVEGVKARRSYKNIAFAAVGLSVIFGIWLLGVERAGSGASRARVKVTDFSTPDKGEAAGGRYPSDPGQNGGMTSRSGVTATHGDVFVISGREKKPIDEVHLKLGDVVETGEEGRALIKMSGERSQVEMDSKTALQIDEEEEHVGPPKLNLRIGNIWVLVKNPSLEVHSPLVSVTAASGAFYRFRVVLSSATTVSVENGTVWVQSKVGDEDLVVVVAGQSLRVGPRGGFELVDPDDQDKPRWLSVF